MARSSSALALLWITIGFTSISLLVPRTLSPLVHRLLDHSESPGCAPLVRHPKLLPSPDWPRRGNEEENGQAPLDLSVTVEKVRILISLRFCSCFQILLALKLHGGKTEPLIHAAL